MHYFVQSWFFFVCGCKPRATSYRINAQRLKTQYKSRVMLSTPFESCGNWKAEKEKKKLMEGSSLLSCSYSSSCSSSSYHHYSSRTHFKFTLHSSYSSSYYSLGKCQIVSMSFIPNLWAKKQVLMPVSCTGASLRASAFVVEKASHNSSTKAKEMMPKIDKSGRFCSPRAARELALYVAFFFPLFISRR